MGGSKRYRTLMIRTKEGKYLVFTDENGNTIRKLVKKSVGRNKRNNKNTKTNPYKLDRGRIRRVLNREYDDIGNKIPITMTRDDETMFLNEYNSAMKNEPEITADVKRISNMINAPLLGEQKRRKSIVSSTQKRNRLIGKNDKSEMNDLVRFTNEVNIDTFGKDVNMALDAYRASGYNVKQVKNFWTKPWAYKGINATLQDKNGKLFEVQFHTKNSFTVKDSKAMHDRYKEQRKYKENSPRYQELDQEMKEIANKLIIEPTGVMDIENVNWF